MSPFMRSRKVLLAKSLDDAVRGCDHYAKVKVCPGPMSLGFVLSIQSATILRTISTRKFRLLRTAIWRKAPASEQQKQWVAKRWGLRGSIYSDRSSEDLSAQKIKTLTKGEAANIITRLKHGAQVIADPISLPYIVVDDCIRLVTRKRSKWWSKLPSWSQKRVHAGSAKRSPLDLYLKLLCQYPT